MKRIKVLEGLVKRVKEAAKMAEKELAQIKQLLTEFTQGVSDLKTAQVAMGLQHFLTILIMLMVGGLVAGVFLSQRPLSVNAGAFAQEGNATDQAGEVEDENGDEASEAVEAPDQIGITADEARAAAEAANPGTKALEVELEYGNGTLVYEVELDNGLEVIVDAANGNILGTEREEAD